MFFLDKPYVSSLLINTIKKNSFLVVDTGIAREMGFNPGPDLIDADRAVKEVQSSDNLMIYATSENSIGWMAEHLGFTGIPDKIALFKNKVKFRELIRPLYPDFYFKGVPLNGLDGFSPDTGHYPFIIKPAVGFFSMGVYKVSTPEEWIRIRSSILQDINKVKDLYPSEVFNSTFFIMEQCIEGDEFAIDAYFNAEGEPVILNITKHIFASADDVTDRVYSTSKKIIQENIEQFTRFLEETGRLADVKNFPVHAEVRREESGRIIPIEINPMRFGGWCTTPDLAWHAYGFNPYEYYFFQKKPQWQEILENKPDNFFSIIVLNNSTGFDTREILSFNYDAVATGFEKILELRKINFKEYPIFGILFAETSKDNYPELEWILASDLKEFVTLNR